MKEQIDRGSIYTLNGPLEIELAEELVDTIPSAEMVRYAKAGGETCALAARIVRGTTGRDIILFCGYHGWHDWYQSANYLVDPESGEYPFAGIEPIGVPRVLAGTAIPFTYGDLDMLSDLLKRYDGQVAAVMMEPARSELPPPGYLEAVKSMAHEHGALLVFDEVSCGWRFRIGGFQEYTGVTPDVTTLAKAMSNGYAMGAVVGSREAMAPAASMFVSSSYWSDNVGLAAALTTIRELKRRNSVPFFDAMGERVKKTMNEAFASAGLAGRLRGPFLQPRTRLRPARSGTHPRRLHALRPGDVAPGRLYPDLVPGHHGPHGGGHPSTGRGGRRGLRAHQVGPGPRQPVGTAGMRPEEGTLQEAGSVSWAASAPPRTRSAACSPERTQSGRPTPP